MTIHADASTQTPRFLAALSRVPAPIVFLLSAALLLLRQPYRGVRHDALLYTGQALSHLDPAWASNDFFFHFGSQDQFSLFARALAVAIAHVGIAPSQIAILLVAQGLFLFAIHLLLREWPAPQRALALLAVAALSHNFGASRTFAILEPFVTARTVAEPLALLAIAALLRGRLVLAGLAIALAGLLHPLVALPVLVTGWAFLVLRDRRWAWGVLAMLPVLGLMAAGIEPFVRLGQVYDPAWQGAIASLTPDVYIGEWEANDFALALGNLVVLWFALRGRTSALATFSRAAIVVAPVLCLVSFVGADRFHDILVTQLQLWRALWIVHLLFVLWLPTLILDEWRRGSTGRLAALTLCAFAPLIGESIPNGWVLTLWAVAMLAVSARGIELKATIRRIVAFAVVVAGLAGTGMMVYTIVYQLGMHARGTAMSHLWSVPFAIAFLTVPLAVVMLGAAARVPHARAGAVLVALGFGAALWQFDQRDAFARRIEAGHGQPHPFKDAIPVDAQVYWEDFQLAPVWIMLQRPSYAASAQSAGAMFSRGAAQVAWMRALVTAPLKERFEECRDIEGMTQGQATGGACRTPEAEFFKLCTAANPADFLVTHEAYARPVAATWRFEPKDGTPAVTYFLHDCRSAR